MKVNIYIELNNERTYKIKRIRWYKKYIDTTGLCFHGGEVWIRKQRFFIPQSLQKEPKETILNHLNELEKGMWYEYRTIP